jgi:hypothetical protein
MLRGITRHRGLATSAAIALTLTLATSALAAHPKAGKKYSGFTSERKFNGFRAPVSFKVSSDATKLQGFKYSTTGCFGSGGRLTPGVNYFLKPAFVQRVGIISVTSKGNFSIKGAKSTYQPVSNQKTVTTSSVTGKFKTSKLASGTITFTQKFSGSGFMTQTCGPVKFTFTAKTG